MADERRRWEDLDMDCLANVFNKVGMESLVLDVPFVCKSWYKASLSPLSWQYLDFPEYKPLPLFLGPRTSFGYFYNKFIKEFGIDRSCFSITAFIKLIVDRSKGNAIVLDLPEFFAQFEEALIYVSGATPLLRKLRFSDDLDLFKDSQILPEVIGRWKLLESLDLRTNIVTISKHILSRYRSDQILYVELTNKLLKALVATEIPGSINVLDRVLVQVGTHCKKFEELSLTLNKLGETEASTIVNLLPNLRFLKANGCELERNSLLKIMQGCKKLGEFRSVMCEGFEEDDKEIIKLGNFKPKGCAGRKLTKFFPDITIYEKATLFKKFIWKSHYSWL